MPPPTLTPADVFGAEAAALRAELHAALAPRHQGLVDRLLVAANTHRGEEQRTDEALRWGAVLAHLPGYAPTLHVLRAHVDDGAAPYCPGGAACQVVWPCPA